MGRHGEKVFLLVFTVLRLVGDNMGKDIETNNWGGGDGGTGDNIVGTVGDIEEGEVFDVVKGSPNRSGGWGILKLGGLRSRVDGLEDTGGDIKRAWIVPSVVRTLKDL